MDDFYREVERVSPYDLFPSPNASNVDDGYLIQRHRLTVKTLESMKGVPGYSDGDIDKVIELYSHKGFRYYEYGDQQRDNLEGKYHSRLYNDNLIEALEFWGPVMGDMLIQWGMTNVDPRRVYEVNAWQIGGYTIKVVLNPDPLGERPYEIASWRSIPGAFWGTALPEIMRDVQIMCNAAARSLANNMGIASGPQVEVAVDRLADGEDVTAMYPWKIWQTTSDKTGGGQPGIRFFMPEMKAAELMGIYNQFAKQADEVTGIPNYIYGGGGGGSGAGRTASGLSMLMDNAAKGIKSAILSVDKVVEKVVHKFYIHNMMYNPDPFIKGDFRVVSRGALGLLAKEQLQIRRNRIFAIYWFQSSRYANHRHGRQGIPAASARRIVADGYRQAGSDTSSTQVQRAANRASDAAASSASARSAARAHDNRRCWKCGRWSRFKHRSTTRNTAMKSVAPVKAVKAKKGMIPAGYANGGKVKPFTGKDTKAEEMEEGREVRSGKVSPAEYTRKEVAEHKREGEPSNKAQIARQGKDLASGKMSPAKYAAMEGMEKKADGGCVGRVGVMHGKNMKK
jgi:hypothetical protein